MPGSVHKKDFAKSGCACFLFFLSTNVFVAHDVNAISWIFFSFPVSLDFSTLYTKFDLADLKALMRVLINKVCNLILKLHHFKF
jgi:hypothetical protein